MTTERLILSAIIGLLLLMQIGTCNEKTALEGDYRLLNEHARLITVQHMEDSSALYSMRINQMDGNVIVDEIMKMRKPTEVVKIVIRTVIKTVIKLADPVQFDSTNYLRLPQTFSQSDKWMSIDGAIDSTGRLRIDSLISSGTFTYAVGDSVRSGLFNRLFKVSDPVVRLHIDNPAIQLTGFSNLYARKQRKWWQSTGAKIGLGVLAGAVGVTLLK
jgi:hypothetical protein